MPIARQAGFGPSGAAEPNLTVQSSAQARLRLERAATDSPSFGLNRLAEHAAAALDGLGISD
jgi:hypothetical protein